MPDTKTVTQKETHTAGPWRLKVVQSERGAGPIGYIKADTDHIEVAVLYGDNEADGHLIAAAPDLLAAAKRSLNWLSSYSGDGAIDVWTQMRVAIAKAEGRSL